MKLRPKLQKYILNRTSTTTYLFNVMQGYKTIVSCIELNYKMLNVRSSSVYKSRKTKITSFNAHFGPVYFYFIYQFYLFLK